VSKGEESAGALAVVKDCSDRLERVDLPWEARPRLRAALRELGWLEGWLSPLPLRPNPPGGQGDAQYCSANPRSPSGPGEVIQIQVEVSAEFLRAIQRLVPCRKGRK